MSYVITGATGHLGRLVVETLLERGVPAEQIVACGRRIGLLRDLSERGVRIMPIDYGDDSPQEVFSRGDRVLFVSAGFGDRVAAHRNVIRFAEHAGVGQLTYTSTIPGLVVSADHEATERMLAQSDVPFTILRNGWYSENFLMDMQRADRMGEYVTSAGDGRIASVNRNDLAEAAANVLMSEGHIGATYTLTADESYGADDLAAVIERRLGRDVPVRKVDPERYGRMLSAAGFPEDFIAYLVAFDTNVRDGLLDVDSNHDLARLLGHEVRGLSFGEAR